VGTYVIVQGIKNLMQPQRLDFQGAAASDLTEPFWMPRLEQTESHQA
jgi:hypothetical protein